MAYIKAKKHKKYKNCVLTFEKEREKNLLQIQADLQSENYIHGEYRKFMVKDPKMREIKAAPFRDRVVHHALCNLIEPIFDQSFIFDSYACRQKKGTLAAVKRLRKFLRKIYAENNKPYCLKCDIQKYFASIDHEILFSLLQKKVKDEKILILIRKIIDSSYDRIEGENLFDRRKTGIPIGNLTSQLFANIYLNELDQFVKHQNFSQKKFPSQKHYLRYMDDFLFLGKNKKELSKIKQEVAVFLEKHLKLKLHPQKANIFPIKNGIDFLGYRFYYPKPVKLRKKTVYRFLKRMRKYRKIGVYSRSINLSTQSFLGFASHADAGGLVLKLQIREY